MASSTDSLLDLEGARGSIIGAMDLDAYFARVGYDGDRSPTTSTLTAIVGRHVQAIPFENLNPFLGWPVPLDLASLERKLVAERRGGYCFEHNTLLHAALETLGFRTTGYAARVVWGGPADAITPRTHMLLRVRVDGEDADLLADVGFGGQTPTAPLRWTIGDPQMTPHGRYRLVAGPGGDLLLEVELADEWKPLYRFDLVPQLPVDYEVANHFVATHPASHFRTSLTCARVTPDGRWALANRQLTHYGLDSTVKRRLLEHAGDLRDALEHDLLVAVPPTADLEELFDRLPS